MERDFMGLNSKSCMIVVKEEAVEGCKQSAFYKGFSVGRPLSNTFDPSSRRQSGEIEENVNQEKKQNVHSMHLRQALSATMNSPFFNTGFAASPMKQQFLGGIPVQAPRSILPSSNCVVGTTQPWFNAKASQTPAQLTIFYEGNVNVFDDISPEKAQAIMLLAGNWSSSAPPSRSQAQPPTTKLAAEDVVFVNTLPCSGLSSPTSISSHPIGQYGCGFPTNNGTAETTRGSSTPVINVGAPKMAITMLPSAVPQARKASLARFLKKRKERVMNSAPYNLSKNFAECDSLGTEWY